MPVIRNLKRARRSGYGHSGGSVSLGVLPAVLLHGTGASSFDEIAIFGGVGLIIGVLIFLSWRAGRKRNAREGRRRRRR